MGYVFMGAAISYREVYLAEGMIVLGLFLLMLYTLYLTKQDPGSIRQDRAHDSFMRTVIVPKGKISQRSASFISNTQNSSSQNLCKCINIKMKLLCQFASQILSYMFIVISICYDAASHSTTWFILNFIIQCIIFWCIMCDYLAQ